MRFHRVFAAAFIALVVQAAAQREIIPPDKAYARSIEPAKQGEAWAQHNIGLCYLTGRTVERDLVQAAQWFKKAADQDYPQAVAKMAECHYYGIGVPTDAGAAYSMLIVVPEPFLDSRSAYILGMCFFDGTGTERDYEQAVYSFSPHAESGDIDCQMMMGFCCETGKGKEKSLPEAVSWYQKAADQGYAAAQIKLADLFTQNESIRDEKKAYLWYKKAAYQGDARSQLLIAAMHLSGKGGAKVDKVEAYAWANLSVVKNDKARKLRDELEESFTPEQVKQAQRRCSDLRTEIDLKKM